MGGNQDSLLLPPCRVCFLNQSFGTDRRMECLEIRHGCAPHHRRKRTALSVADACEAQVGDSFHMAITAPYHQCHSINGVPRNYGVC